MSHSEKNRVGRTPAAKRALAQLATPRDACDASRYCRGGDGFGFYNVGTPAVRRLSRSIARTQKDWSAAEALAFADILITDRHLEVKALAVEVLSAFRPHFTPRLLPIWKRWLAINRAAHWATTDGCAGSLSRRFSSRTRIWSRMSRHPNRWVRRASAVSFLASIRKGRAIADAYNVARALHADDDDLIQKAVGWMLREAGTVDPDRLERYLRANGPRIPRTTVRYAIERFVPVRRRAVLEATKPRGR